MENKQEEEKLELLTKWLVHNELTGHLPIGDHELPAIRAREVDFRLQPRTYCVPYYILAIRAPFTEERQFLIRYEPGPSPYWRVWEICEGELLPWVNPNLPEAELFSDMVLAQILEEEGAD